jgi:hypothetical protein
VSGPAPPPARTRRACTARSRSRTRRRGNELRTAILEVLPRPTPAERYDAAVSVEVDEALTGHAAVDQLDIVDDSGEELVLIFEERDGIAKAARLTANGLDIKLFHILTFT